jgi:type II secretory ATPase GspE/PulE/Tfp pilus assembly ATPase PilB-like protein
MRLGGLAMKTPVHEIALLQAISERTAVQAFVDMVLLLAIKDKATEVRFRATDVECTLSYQVDGNFHDLVPPPGHVAKKIINVIKVMADLDFASRNRPKERWIHLKVANHLETVQVLIQRGEKYEEVIMRLLHPVQATEEAKKLLKDYSERRR